MSHTPGNWAVVEHLHEYGDGESESTLNIEVEGGEGPVIAFVAATPEHATAWFDGCLLAAAPALLQALEAVVAVADRSTIEFDRARAAISKAKGEAAGGQSGDVGEGDRG